MVVFLLKKILGKIKGGQAEKASLRKNGEEVGAYKPLKTAKGAFRAVAMSWNNQEAQVASQSPCIRTIGVSPRQQCSLKLPGLFQCAAEVDIIALEVCCSYLGLRTSGIGLP